MHRSVLHQYLQGDVNEYTFRQSYRHAETRYDRPMFFTTLRKIVPVEQLVA